VKKRERLELATVLRLAQDAHNTELAAAHTQRAIVEFDLAAARAEIQKLRIEIECLRDALEMHRKAERHRVRDATAANVSPDSVTELAMARVDLGVAHTTIEDLTLDIERYRDILRMNRNAQAKDEILGNLAAWGLRDGGPPDVLTDAATELAMRMHRTS